MVGFNRRFAPRGADEAVARRRRRTEELRDDGERGAIPPDH